MNLIAAPPAPDTVKFMLANYELPGVDLLSEIPVFLDDPTEVYKGGSVTITGKIGNLSARVTANRVVIGNGSLCKWYKGDNYQSMTREEVKDAVEKLSDTTHLPIAEAKVMRLDMGASFLVEEPPENYMLFLGDLSRALRSELPGTLYYERQGGKEILCFYDKHREQRKHKGAIPEQFKGKNVLRYEQRFLGKLPRLLNVERVSGAMLYDENFYRLLIKKWENGYKSIEKLNKSNMTLEEIKGRRDLMRAGLVCLIEKMGGAVKAAAEINARKKRGAITEKQAESMKRLIKDVSEDTTAFMSRPVALDELDQKITAATKAGE